MLLIPVLSGVEVAPVLIFLYVHISVLTAAELVHVNTQKKRVHFEAVRNSICTGHSKPRDISGTD